MKAIKTFPYYTLAELQTKYPDVWVLLLNPDENPADYYPKGGYFVAKFKSKEKAIEKSMDENLFSHQKVRTFRVFFTGKIKLPENHVICL